MKKTFEWLRIILFAAVLVGCCVVGLILPLRPTASESEGRKLTEFPTFTWEAFLSGEYTAQVSLWYADSYPGREAFLDMNSTLKGYYGVGGDEFSGYGGVADELETNPEFIWGEVVTSPEDEETKAPDSHE